MTTKIVFVGVNKIIKTVSTNSSLYSPDRPTRSFWSIWESTGTKRERKRESLVCY